MAQTYMPRRREENAVLPQEKLQTTISGPSLQELAAGAAPSREQMGRLVDLPEAIRAKMEASFGADFSNVRLYESQTVADAGAEAIALGGAIGFAPGKLDFSSTAGQTMLGHELSHVVSQARGEVSGEGFLNDRALEARADREGALAAAGESVYSGPVAPLSASAVPASTAGVAQAWGKEKTISNPTLVKQIPQAEAIREQVRDMNDRWSPNAPQWARIQNGLNSRRLYAPHETLLDHYTNATEKYGESFREAPRDNPIDPQLLEEEAEAFSPQVLKQVARQDRKEWQSFAIRSMAGVRRLRPFPEEEDAIRDREQEEEERRRLEEARKNERILRLEEEVDAQNTMYPDAVPVEANQFKEDFPNDKSADPKGYFLRYLQSSLLDQPKEERPKMYAAFRKKEPKAMLPYVANSLKEFLNIDSEGMENLVSDDEEIRMEQLKAHNMGYQRAVNLDGILKEMMTRKEITKEMLAGQGVTEEDLERFDQGTDFVGNASQLATNLTRFRDMKGTENNDIWEELEMRRRALKNSKKAAAT